MVFTLIKRDPTWKLAMSLAVAMPVLWAAMRSIEGGNVSISMLLVFVVAGAARTQQRASLYQAALPIEARNLFLARALSFVMLAGLPLLTVTPFLLLALGKEAWPEALRMLAMVALFLFGAMVNLSVRVREFTSPDWAGYAATLLIVPVLLIYSQVLSPALVLPFAAIGGGVAFAAAWVRLPRSFQCAPLAATGNPEEPAREGIPASPWRVIARCISPAKGLGFLPSFLLAAAMGQWQYGILVLSFVTLLKSGEWLTPLPVSRRALLTIKLFPLFALILSGEALVAYLATHRDTWQWIPPLHDAPRISSGSRASQGGTPNVQAPPEFWRSTNGSAPAIESPWGESAQPTTVSILGIRLYNPYAVGRNNSRRFLQWQFGRALQAVYGRTVSAEEFREILRSGDLPKTWIPLDRQARGESLRLACMLAFALILQWFTGCLAWRRFRRLCLKVPSSLVTAALVLPPLLLVAADLYLAHSFDDSFILPSGVLISGFIQFLMRTLPPGWWSVLADSAILIALPYWVLQKQFNESEIAVQNAGLSGGF